MRPRAVAKYLDELGDLGVMKKGVERAVVKICAWQWVEFEPVEMEWVLGERVAGVLQAIDRSGKLKSVRLEIQEDGQDEGKPVFEDLIARFRRVAPGEVKTSLQGGSVRYRAGQMVEEGTPLVKSFEL